MIQFSERVSDDRGLRYQVRDLRGYDQDEISLLLSAAELVVGQRHARHAEIMLSILADLQMDAATLSAGMFLFCVQAEELELKQVEHDEPRKLVGALLRLRYLDRTVVSPDPILNRGRSEQLSSARSLLMDMIDDPRVAVVKLAEQATILDFMSGQSDAERSKTVRDAFDFYAPLASRLGIFKLKWLLEDLAFRCLSRREYDAIASAIGTSRSEREREIRAICEDLSWRLQAENINATVRGRAKHFYAIWRKMRTKRVSLSEVRDIEAVRVIVDTNEDCYKALGVVHTSWPYISEEFDDYIASPKENDYQSIHTGVVGPGGRTLEVQIRSKQMHEAAELGTCSHWAYKGIADSAMQSHKADWLRSVIEWQSELHRDATDADLFKSDDAVDRVYVTTPQGHVVDLVRGSTAVDFAYRIHTDIGNTCSVAFADGRAIALNQPLSSGMTVEIRTDPEATPRREWLQQELGYVRTARAREKVQAWFREREAAGNIEAGRRMLDENLQRLGLRVELGELLKLTDWGSESNLLHAVGVGDQRISELVQLLVHQSLDEPQHSVISPAAGEAPQRTYTIEIAAADRPRLLVEIATLIADCGVELLSAVAQSEDERKRVSITVEVQVADLFELSSLIDRLRSVVGVHDVRRSHP